jgi:hypothetical protein
MIKLKPLLFSILWYLVFLIAAVLLMPFSSFSQSDSTPASKTALSTDVADGLQKDLDVFLERQGDVAGLHRKFAFLTAGFLLLGDALGTYHFFALQASGHDYCRAHSQGMNSDSIAPAVYRAGILQAWGNSESQLLRVLHGGTIALGAISYTATATMELTMPRMIKDNRPFSSVNVHHGIFYFHAGLMVANIGLGFLESYALSRGNHDLVIGAGIAHLIVGYALPIVITTSGLVYKLDL